MLTDSSKRTLQKKYADNKHLLRIPRRPAWTRDMPAELLCANERDSFLAWRRGLAELQEQHGYLMTPFERNIELWRQLWRVIERTIPRATPRPISPLPLFLFPTPHLNSLFQGD